MPTGNSSAAIEVLKEKKKNEIQVYFKKWNSDTKSDNVLYS